MLNLDDHFFQCQDAFVTFNELKGFCAKHSIATARGKTNLVKALEAMGAKRGKCQWANHSIQDCFMYIGLRDKNLLKDKEYWGKGVKIWEA